MALTPEIRSPQGGVIGVIRQSATETRVSQAFPLTIYNVPSEEIQVTYGGNNVVFRQLSQQMQATQGHLVVVGKGRIDNPKLRAWAFTLDGHDFYVLKLGTGNKTLVLDITTGQWSWWTNGGIGNWRSSVGMNWRTSGNIPQNKGSNIIVGDDSYGLLWVLDPLFGVDDPILGTETRSFTRVATGQIPNRGRVRLPVFNVYLTASLGQPAYEGASCTLSYSDDQGNNYVSAGSITTQTDNYAQEFVWRSLGQIPAPGRLFRIEDDGAFARIDSLDVNIE